VRESRAILLLALLGCRGVSLSERDADPPGITQSQPTDSGSPENATRDAPAPMVPDAQAVRDERDDRHSEGEACGADGQPCCGDQRCIAPGTVCYVPKESVPPIPPFCRSCGLPGQPCCVKRTCVDGAACTGPGRGACLRS